MYISERVSVTLLPSTVVMKGLNLLTRCVNANRYSMNTYLTFDGKSRLMLGYRRKRFVCWLIFVVIFDIAALRSLGFVYVTRTSECCCQPAEGIMLLYDRGTSVYCSMYKLAVVCHHSLSEGDLNVPQVAAYADRCNGRALSNLCCGFDRVDIASDL